MVAEPSFARLVIVEIWLAIVYAGYNGAMIVHLTEMMPGSVRTTGFSLAYSLATSIFGGFTPALATWLIDQTGNKASPGLWLTAAAAVSLLCALAAGNRVKTRSQNCRLKLFDLFTQGWPWKSNSNAEGCAKCRAGYQ